MNKNIPHATQGMHMFPICIDLSPSYLFEAAHEIVANWRSGQVGSAGAPTHVEKIIGAQHGVVFLGVASSGEDPINGDSHLLRGNT